MQPTKQATVELLDKGQFILTYFPEGIETRIKGRFTMVVFDRFCTLKNIDSYFNLLKKITTGLSIGEYADLTLMAFQDYYRPDGLHCPVTRVTVLDMIDELGGIGEEFLKIIFHALGRVMGGVVKPEEEKKSPEVGSPKVRKPKRKKR